jgi:hypothetical protein
LREISLDALREVRMEVYSSLLKTGPDRREQKRSGNNRIDQKKKSGKK